MRNDRKVKIKCDINDFFDHYSVSNMFALKTQYSYLQNSEHVNYIGKFEKFPLVKTKGILPNRLKSK